MSGLFDKVKGLFRSTTPGTPATSTAPATAAAKSRKTSPAPAHRQAASHTTAPPAITLTAADLELEFYQAVFNSEVRRQSVLSVPEKLAAQVVEETLKSAEQRSKAIPRLPTVVPQLLQSLRDPKASADSFVEIIRQDPVIASAVLKMANSAYFNPNRTRIDSFQRAVVTLGIQGLRSILSSAVMQPIIQCKSPFFIHFGKKLWDHSLCCAVSCQVIALQEGHEPFKAYLTGLIHDIGKITVFTQLTQQLKLNPDDKKPPAHVFVYLMEKFAPELSCWIAKDWGFPDDIVNAIKAQVNVKDPAQLTGMANMLYRANQASIAYLLTSQGVLTESQAQMLLIKSKLPDNLFNQLDAVYTETN